MKRLLPLLALLFAFAALPAAGSATLPDSGPLAGGDHPLGLWDGFPQPPAAVTVDPAWSLRTGFRKGVADLVLPEEKAAAPDVAVLRSGIFAPWSAILAAFREDSVPAEPDAIAGTSDIRPVLIIPSGGLAGLAASEYFKAGLQEYVFSGGTVICFSQRTGADLAALPVPSGVSGPVSGAGWTEDGGPLFRASSVAARHPALAGLANAVPSIETDGHIAVFPPAATVLLKRPDGKATLVVYPVGKGWVALSSLASDHAYDQGLREPDEMVLVRDLVRWAKARGALPALAPGRTFSATLALQGPDQGVASAVRIRVLSPTSDRPQDERTIPVSVSAQQRGSLAYSFTVPASAQPGIYHLEYELLDAAERSLSPRAETAEGWFAVLPPAAPPQPKTRPVDAAPLPGAIEALPSVEHADGRSRLKIALSRRGRGPGLELLVRAAGREETVKPDGERTVASFDLGELRSPFSIPYAVHTAAGRLAARGTIIASPPAAAAPSLDRTVYAPGQTIRVSVPQMGPGVMTVTGPGLSLSEHIRTGRVFEVPLEAGLPAGIYAVSWEFRSRAGGTRHGLLPLVFRGAAVRCLAAGIERGKDGKAEARLTIDASAETMVKTAVQLTAPDGTSLPPAETTAALIKGRQVLSLPLTFVPGQAGMWLLTYALTASFPEGPGYPMEPMVLASGRAAVDAGDAAVIGIATDRPLYYEPSGTPSVTAYVAGAGGSRRVEVRVDDARVARERFDVPGTAALSARLDGLAQGRHTVAVIAKGDELTSARTLSFQFGSRLPDLAAAVRVPAVAASPLEIGVEVTNRGKVNAGGTTAALYEGEPERGGTLIGSIPVPPLGPGRQFTAAMPWPLAGKAGMRKIVLVADRDRSLVETGKENNTASASVDVPPLGLLVRTDKTSYGADERPRYEVIATNFLTEAVPSLRIDLETAYPDGSIKGREPVTVTGLAPGAVRTVERELDLSAPRQGSYRISATASAGPHLAAASAAIDVRPTLLLAGTLEGTPQVASPCMSFEIRYAARDAGTIKVRSGTLKIEIRSRENDQPVFAKQLPFTLAPGSVAIDRIDLPRGSYTVLFSGAASGPGLDAREFLLDRRPLTVSGPIDVDRSLVTLPRILVWAGGDDATTIEQALAEKIVREAFDQEDVFLKTVSSGTEFVAEARSGLYTVLVLFESSGAPDVGDVLQDALGRRRSVLLIGPGERVRSDAGALGFTFIERRAADRGGIMFPADSGLELTGTVPVAGPALSPGRAGTQTLASFADGAPAVLRAPSGGGTVMIMPVSLVRSALASGVSALYSLLLRSAVRSLSPPPDVRDDVHAVRVSYAAPSGPLAARITESLPPGSTVLWVSEKATERNGSLAFDVIAGRDPARILYLFRATAQPARLSGEVFYECQGGMVSQGKGE